MHLKTRVFGLFTGALLVLSIVHGVVAQTTTTVRLTEAACAPAITEGSVNFGTYIYDRTLNSGQGGFKAATGTDGKASFTVRDSSTGRQANCRIQVEASRLLDSLAGNGINVSLKETPSGTAGNPITVTVAPTGSKTVEATLPDSLPGSSRLDTYTGTITVTTASGS